LNTRVFTSPLFLGFDHLEQMLERASKNSSDGYPPYNIEQTGPTGLRITLAVAGFAMDDLQITQEDNQLVIRGRQRDDSEGRIFLHRGIAARAFQRSHSPRHPHLRRGKKTEASGVSPAKSGHTRPASTSLRSK
jgi:HSP20 family molecular chaperone IbpA